MAKRGKKGRRGSRRYRRDRRGRFAAGGALTKAGYARTRMGDTRGRTYTKGVAGSRATKGIGSRAYVVAGRRGGVRQVAVVRQIKGGRFTREAPKNNRTTQAVIKRGHFGGRPGVPLAGSGGRARYVSRGHARYRSVSALPSAAARAHSRTLVRRSDRRQQLPKSGYVVTYP